jgi:4-amino-4-deoxy-L-arabinose transferase-like glycosyltransferase
MAGARLPRLSLRWLRGASDAGWRRNLFLILGLATIVRLAMILATPHAVLFGDPVDYQRHAVSIAAGRGYPRTEIATPGKATAFRPPGYPFLLGGLYAVVGVSVDAGRVLGGVLGVLTVLLIALLGRSLWGPRVGLIGAGIAAVFPPLVALDASLVSESLFLPLELAFALAVVALWRRPGELRWALLAGLTCALCALTRAVADAWLLVALVVVLSAAVRVAVRWRAAGALVASFALVLTPWTIRNLDQLHAFVPISTEDGYTLAGQYNPDTAVANDFEAVWRLPPEVPSLAARTRPLFARPGGVGEAELNHVLLSAGVHYFEHHPGHLAVASALNTLRLVDLGVGHDFVSGLSYREMGVPADLQGLESRSAQLLTLLALLSVLARVLLRGRFSLGPRWLWAIPLLTLALTVPMVGNPIKRAPLDPFLVLIVAVAADAAWSGAGRVLGRRHSGA